MFILYCMTEIAMIVSGTFSHVHSLLSQILLITQLVPRSFRLREYTAYLKNP